MNYKNLKVTFSLILLLSALGLQAHNGNYCSRKHKNTAAAKTTTAAPEENDYDVRYVKLDLSLTNTSTAVTGDATTRAQVITANPFNVYAFELDNQLTIDAIQINGAPVTTYARTGSVVYVNLSAALPQNSVFTARVQYHGQPTAGSGFFTSGLNLATVASGTKIMYTLSDMYLADQWWPCKQSITDKIDSADIWVTVDQNLKAGSNGLLQQVTPMPGSKKRFEWKTRYPIDYYLISVAVAPYADYSYYMHYTDGSGDSMLIQNYVYDSLAFMTPANKGALDTTGFIVDHFSKLFDKYPFYKEKYGHCMAEPLGGGMEHQTMTTLAYAIPTLIAHELGHQWWGDHVTYGSWRDIWLSEGFATYCEVLYVEQFNGADAAQNYRTGIFNEVVNAVSTGGTVYVDDTTDAARVFSSRLTYKKGGAVAHMLRYIAPQDGLYFSLLQKYQQRFANANAVTSDLQAMAETEYGMQLDTFFDQWIYKEGIPTYSLKWYQDGNKVYLQMNQTTTRPASVATFAMPVEIKLRSASGDTVIKVYNNLPTQNYSLVWDKAITTLQIDPYDNVLNKTGAITKDPRLSVAAYTLEQIKVSPNPAGDVWEVQALLSGTKLELRDMAGRIVWKSTAGGKASIPAKELPQGNYLLTIQVKGLEAQQRRLVKI